jgi:tRNA threonylcarbamoyladenosine biosynthesis protein TsaE
MSPFPFCTVTLLKMETKYIISNSPEETFAFGRTFAERLGEGDCVAISGELGAGKTHFIQGICDLFQCAEQVTSPTFTIINEYNGTLRIAHCDLYRLDAPGEMLDAGLEGVLEEETLVLIEWAEKAIRLLPYPRWEVLLEHGDEENIRRIRTKRCGTEEDSFLAAARAAAA